MVYATHTYIYNAYRHGGQYNGVRHTHIYIMHIGMKGNTMVYTTHIYIYNAYRHGGQYNGVRHTHIYI